MTTDSMDDATAIAYHGWPNNAAVLIGKDGNVVTYQEWFDASANARGDPAALTPAALDAVGGQVSITRALRRAARRLNLLAGLRRRQSPRRRRLALVPLLPSLAFHCWPFTLVPLLYEPSDAGLRGSASFHSEHPTQAIANIATVSIDTSFSVERIIAPSPSKGV